MSQFQTTIDTKEPDSLLSKLIDKFSTATACWYSSIRPNSRTHLAPIWHVWLDGSVYVVTKTTSVRARNLGSNNSVSLALPDPMNVLIIEGIASFVTDTVFASQSLYPLFQSKYNWDIISDSEYQSVIRVTPSKLLAWGEHGEGRWSYRASDKQWSKK